jgi:UDP-3-O-[3-hydroxymyristoyl] glucosamine N-acyltransferase
MDFKATDIAEFLNGEVVGNGDVKVSNVSKIEEGKPGTLSFLSNLKYESFIYKTEASIVLVNKDFIPKEKINATLIKVDDAYQALASLLELYEQTKMSTKIGIEQPSFINDSSTIGENIYVGAFAYVGKNCKIGKNVKLYPQVYIGDNVSIGDNCILYSGVKIYYDSVIGNSCIIHASAVIGADGFGFAPQDDGTFKKIAQIGNVVLEDNVEIGANTTIDRGTMGSTLIRKGAKIDNLVQIGHNCEVGENTVMAGQVGLAGTTKVGKNCQFGGQVGLGGHLNIGDNVLLGAQSGLKKDVKDGEVLFGSPAIPIKDAMKSIAVYKNLPTLQRDVSKLKRDINEIKNK